MRQFLQLFFIGLIITFSSNVIKGQTYSVTFKVDMSEETVSDSGVHIAGDFQTEAGFPEDWDPSSTSLSDSDNDNIYETSLDIPEGTYEYKFVNGNDWDGGENPPDDCTVGSNNNREVSIYSDLNLPVVLFDSCNAQLNLEVNMSNENISSDGVHVMGDFQKAAGYGENWDPGSIQMQDSNNDSIYEVQLKVAPGDYTYLFVNGSTSGDAENPPDSCTIEDSNGKNVRPVTAKAGGNEPQTYCFNSCNICEPAISANYETYWWNETVFYEIFVRSFNDSDGDGIGDFQGIIEKLDYLNDGDSTTNSDLGVKGIWLMPFNESPSYHGYDITDYYATNPDYGGIEDLEKLLEEAHKRGIKVIMDFVMNHSSNQHSWFTKSANNTDSYRDWYLWQSSDLGNNWHYRNGDYYYGIFWSGMPDLNYQNSSVKDKMFDITNYWLNKGIDGFRLDAIKHLYEDNTGNQDTQETLSILEEFKNVYTTNNPKAFSVGEVWSSTSEIVPYVGKDRLDACFEFNLASSIINAVNDNNPDLVENKLNEITEDYPRLQYATFLSNHDQDRIFNQLGNNTNKMKQAASIYLTLPGIPFVYYGEEIGMTGTGEDINKRRPMQWNDNANAGFSSTSPWTDLGNNYETNNVEGMENDSTSLLEHYKKFIHIRNNQDVLQKGYFTNITSENNQILSFARIYQNKAAIILSNFGSETENVNISLENSSLEDGTYKAADLISGNQIDTISVESGSIVNWQLSDKVLSNRETRILLISKSNQTTLVEETDEPGDFSVFPNPAEEYFKVNFENTVSGSKLVEVYNMLGKKLYEKKITGKQHKISTSSWTPGIYLVRVKTNEFTKTRRLLVK